MKANSPVIRGTPFGASLRLVTWFLSLVFASTAAAQSYPVDGNGWSIVTPSSDSRLIYVSAAGLGGSVTITMGSNVCIGLAVTSHNDGTLCMGPFPNVTATP